MDGDTWMQIMFILLLIGVNAFFAASEMAIVSVRQSRLKPLLDEGNSSAKIVSRFIEEPSKLLATIQIGVTLSGFFTSAVGSATLSDDLAVLLSATNVPVIAQYSRVIATLIITMLLAFVTLVLGELAPKRLALEKSERIALKVAKTINAIALITTPIVKLLTVSTNMVVRLFGVSNIASNEHITEEEIRLMINVGEEKGIFQETETDMINSIFEFDDTEAKEVMTPRTDIIAVNVDDSMDTVFDVIISENFSRIPVYEDSIDNIIGILYVKDLFAGIRNCTAEKIQLRDIIRAAYFVPEYIKTNALFKEMQKSKTHIAIVIDEYGGTAGLITIEDLLEEIVGNIFDEYDEEEQEHSKIDDNTYIISGRLSISEVNDLMDLKLPEEEFDTISGLLLSLTGTMPTVGQEVDYEDVSFRIEEIDDKRIDKIKVVKRV